MRKSSLCKTNLSLAFIWLAMIWILSSIPSSSLPSVKIFSFDKLSHFGVYFILGLLVNRWFREKGYSRRTITLIYTFIVLNAALDEWHQSLIPGRSVSLWDLLANFAGILAARLTLRHYHD